jgi:purine-binding chemotaxis protein CheW
MKNRLTQGESLRVLRLEVGGESFGLDMTQVQSIQRADRLLPAGPGAAGKLRSGQGDLDVYRLADLLGRETAAGTSAQQVVVLKEAPRPVGLLVERAARVVEVPTRQFYPLPALLGEESGEIIQGVLNLEDDLLLLLAPETLIDAGIWQTAPRRGPAALPPVGGLRPPGRGSPKQVVLFNTAQSPRHTRPVTFGLGLNRVSEIMEPTALIPVPGAADFVFGLVRWRDRPVPVLDLARRLGLPPTVRDRRTRLMIVHLSVRAGLAGFLVRPSIRIRHLPLPHWPACRPLPLDPARIKVVVELKGETLVIPDLAGLLATPELLSVS